MGWRYGAIVAAIASFPSFIEYPYHPYLEILSILEAARLGWNWQYGRRNLIACDLWFWLIAGLPFLSVVHHYSLSLPWNASILVALQHGVEHLLCVTIASFVLFYSPYVNWLWINLYGRPLSRSVRQVAFNFLIATVFIPILMITSIDSHLFRNEIDIIERNQLVAITHNIVELIKQWETWGGQNATQLKVSLEHQNFGFPLYISLVSEDGRIAIDKGANFPGWYQLRPIYDRHLLNFSRALTGGEPATGRSINRDGETSEASNKTNSSNYTGFLPIRHYIPKRVTTYELDTWRHSFYRITRNPTLEIPWRIEVALSIAPRIERLEWLYIRHLGVIFFVMLVAILMADVLGDRFAAPLRQLGEQTTNLPQKLTGDDTIIWPTFGLEEIDQLSSNFKLVSQVLQSKFREIYRTNEELEIRVRDRTQALEIEIEERKRITRIIQKSQQRLSLLVEQSPLAIMEWNLDGKIVAWNPAAEIMFGYTADEAIGQVLVDLVIPTQLQLVLEDLLSLRENEQSSGHSCVENITREGKYLLCNWHNAPLIDADDQTLGIVSLIQDITAQYEATRQLAQRTTDLETALSQLQKTQVQLVHSEKMSSLGQLVAGVAHEINNPVGFIHGNLSFAREHAESLLLAIEYYRETYPESHDVPDVLDLDLPFIQSDFPALLQSMKMGTERIREIVNSLRNFSRLDESDRKRVDLSEGIDNTLLILQHRLNSTDTRSEIQIRRNYCDLPQIICYPGQLNQVFMNLIANAIDAIEGTAPPHTITIEGWVSDSQGTIRHDHSKSQSLQAGDWIYISIHDTGCGIPKAVQAQIFDPFFTTKPIGSGTGMGLSICHQIIVEKHNGTLTVSSNQTGTTLTLGLPE
ncbi:MAG: PAS domain S-box protein [Coleofasciculaceae cyanobacterium RL_1_1]|nr:PAS domain S-box protein [Coleofasciculaceae cyanobacterium RL_1_1]